MTAAQYPAYLQTRYGPYAKLVNVPGLKIARHFLNFESVARYNNITLRPITHRHGGQQQQLWVMLT